MPMSVKQDITGKRFGMIVARQFIPCQGKYAKYLCLCDCGKEKVILSQSLRNGSTRSCGCQIGESTAKRMTTHGQSGKGRTKTYNSWAGMMDRCVWGGHPSYASYGAAGIGVCERWHSFENFYTDMGERPKNSSIDRIDNTKGYSPENCRWATTHGQARNTSRSWFVVVEGEHISLMDYCERSGISHKAIRARAHRRNGDFYAALISAGHSVDYVYQGSGSGRRRPASQPVR